MNSARMLMFLMAGMAISSLARGMETTLNRPSVLVLQARIVEIERSDERELGIETIFPFLEYFESSQKPLLIVAEDIEADELATLVVKRLQGFNRIVFMTLPPNRANLLKEIADSTRATILTSESDWDSPVKISTLLGSVAAAVFDAAHLEINFGDTLVSEVSESVGSGVMSQSGSASTNSISYALRLIADTGPPPSREERQQEYLQETLGGALGSILAGAAGQEPTAGDGNGSQVGGDYCCRENERMWMEYRNLTTAHMQDRKSDCSEGKWFEGRCPEDRKPWWECVMAFMKMGGIDGKYIIWGSEQEASDFCDRLPGPTELNRVE